MYTATAHTLYISEETVSTLMICLLNTFSIELIEGDTRYYKKGKTKKVFQYYTAMKNDTLIPAF